MKLDEPTRGAINATLHCLSGCALGEVLGLIIGTALGLSTLATIGIAVALAFVFGYVFTAIPLVRSGMALRAALGVALAADTVSIAVMEVADNLVMLLIPGAMAAGIVNPLFWLSLPLALAAAFLVAVPVNRYLISRGLGHAVVHQHHAQH